MLFPVRIVFSATSEYEKLIQKMLILRQFKAYHDAPVLPFESKVSVLIASAILNSSHVSNNPKPISAVDRIVHTPIIITQANRSAPIYTSERTTHTKGNISIIGKINFLPPNVDPSSPRQCRALHREYQSPARPKNDSPLHFHPYTRALASCFFPFHLFRSPLYPRYLPQ